MLTLRSSKRYLELELTELLDCDLLLGFWSHHLSISAAISDYRKRKRPIQTKPCLVFLSRIPHSGSGSGYPPAMCGVGKYEPMCNCVLHNHTAHGGLCFAFVGFMAIAGTKEKPTKPNPEKPKNGKRKKKYP